MENKADEHYCHKNSDLFQIWLKGETKEQKHELILQYITKFIGLENISDTFQIYLLQRVRIFCANLKVEWDKCHRSQDFFNKKRCVWLDAKTTFTKKNVHEEDKSEECPMEECSDEPSTSGAGRPCLLFSEKSDRSKRREAAELLKYNENEPNLFIHAASMSARKQGNLDLAVVLKKAVESPTRPSKIRKLCTQNVITPIVLSEEEALAFHLENNFSKKQYTNIRVESKLKNADIFPSYKKILAAKSKCRPDGITVSESTAKVPLQALLNHTATRIIELQKEVIISVMNSENTNYMAAEFILSYGFDGSTGQAQYKQSFLEPSTSRFADSCLLATTVIPLRILHSSGKPLWNNRTPQSTRFCRPLKLEFTKETCDVILKEEDDLKKQVEKLKTLRITVEAERVIEIKFNLSLTIIDGKVLNVITGTKSTQTCPVCGGTPKDFIKITDYNSEKFRPANSNLKHGISPLHCWIRFFEFVLHLGYKSGVKKWQIKSDEDKKVVMQKKEKVQNEFWTGLGLRVDVPKTGGSGNTNDGNTSRRAFADHKLFSKITDVEEELIFRFKIILTCLSCQFPLNLVKFEMYCFQTAALIQNKYPWLPMTPTVHKVLIHSKQIMQNTALPVGYFAEDAAESRNKLYKSDRLHHARKTSRVDNLTDVFNRALDTSDPLVSSLRINTRVHQRKRLTLPPEVIELLCYEDPLGTPLPIQHIDDDECMTDEDEDYEEENLVLDNEF